MRVILLVITGDRKKLNFALNMSFSCGSVNNHSKDKSECKRVSFINPTRVTMV